MLSSVASLRAHQTRMNVIGDNIANVNTAGYKGRRASFQDLYSQTLRGATAPTDGLGGRDPMQTGTGVRVSAIPVDMSQGSFAATNRQTDMAIQGGGFFAVSNGEGLSYTRDGGFHLDANGSLVHSATGHRLIGWSADPATGAVDTSAVLGADSTLTLPLGQLTEVQPTANIEWAGNLSATAGVGDTATGIVRVIDSLGEAHDAEVEFTKTAANEWSWTATGAAGSGTVTFDPGTGQLAAGGTGSLTLTPGNGGAATTINVDFSSMSGLAADSEVIPASQDGYPAGTLSSFAVGADGAITGFFSNGLSRTLGVVALASFTNEAGLSSTGANLWTETVDSGQAVLGAAHAGSRGAIASGYIEQSNVDLGTEFTDLIITQRGFQANTRVVTSVDEMLQELLSLKR